MGSSSKQPTPRLAAPGRARDPRSQAEVPAVEPGGAEAPSDTAVLLEHGAVVERICRSRLSSAADVDDAIQDTYVRFLTRRNRAVSNPEAWLVTAARRACQDLIRRRARRHEVDIPESVADSGRTT